MLSLEVKKKEKGKVTLAKLFSKIFILHLHYMAYGHFIFPLPVKAVTSEMTTHCNILAWEIPGTEENARLKSMEL